MQLRLMCPHAELLLGRADRPGQRGDAGRSAVAIPRWASEGGSEGSTRILVVAIGSSLPRVLPISIVADHGLGFHDLADAIRLRNHVLRRLDGAAAAHVLEPAEVERELTFVFVGASYAGVEALGELSDLVRDALRYYPMLRDAHAGARVLADAAPKILPEIRRRARANTPPSSWPSVASTSACPPRSSPQRPASGQALRQTPRSPPGRLVWTAGVRSRPAVQRVGLPPRRARSRSRVDEFLRVEGPDWTLLVARRQRGRPERLAAPDHPDPPTSHTPCVRLDGSSQDLTGAPQPYRFPHARPGGDARPLQGHCGSFRRTYRLRGYLHLVGHTARTTCTQLPGSSRGSCTIMTYWTESPLFFRRDIAHLGMLTEPKRKLGE